MKDDTTKTNIGDIITPVSEKHAHKAESQLMMKSAVEADDLVNTEAKHNPASGEGVNSNFSSTPNLATTEG